MLKTITIFKVLVNLLFCGLMAFMDDGHQLAILFPALWRLEGLCLSFLEGFGLSFFQRRCDVAAANRAFALFVAASFLGLAIYNDPFYYNTIGRVLDLFFSRDPYDPETPGSGFVDFCDILWRHNGGSILDALRAIRNTIVTISLILGTIGAYALCRIAKQPTLEDVFQWAVEHPGEPRPDWVWKVLGVEPLAEKPMVVEEHTWGAHERVYDSLRGGGGVGWKLEDYHAEACYNRRRAMEGLKPVKYFS